MSKQLKKVTPKFILLNPLCPSFFGYDTGEVTRMVNELSLVGVSTLMVNTGKELFLYAHSPRKEMLEQLCTAYDLSGILVEATGVYDQVEITEFA